MIRVVIESPYAGDVAENLAYAKRCVHDLVPEERKLGIEAGFAWGVKADIVAVYVDRGISKGMEQGIARALAANQSIDFRTLEGADLSDYPPLRVPLKGTPQGEK